MMIIAGGRTIESLYMGPALVRLARFPNVVVVPVCSTPQTVTQSGEAGPADRLSAAPAADRCALRLRRAGDGRFDQIDRGAHRRGLLCGSVPADHRRHGRGKRSDPRDEVAGTLSRPAGDGQFALDRPLNRRRQPMQAYRMAEARVRSHYRPQSA